MSTKRMYRSDLKKIVRGEKIVPLGFMLAEEMKVSDLDPTDKRNHEILASVTYTSVTKGGSPDDPVDDTER